MSKYKVKIVATSVAEFTNIEEKLLQLPEVIYEQIAEARNHVGIECIIRDIYPDDKQLILPNTITHQTIIDEHVNIYCGRKGDTEYRFVLNKRMSAHPRSYRFIELVTT